MDAGNNIALQTFFFFLTKIHASDTPSEDEISINGNLHKKSFA